MMEGGSGLADFLTLALREKEVVARRAAEGLDGTKYYILFIFNILFVVL